GHRPGPLLRERRGVRDLLRRQEGQVPGPEEADATSTLNPDAARSAPRLASPAHAAGMWTERSEVPLARLHRVEVRSNPSACDGGNAPLRAPDARAGESDYTRSREHPHGPGDGHVAT